jgi:hypothetical protein
MLPDNRLKQMTVTNEFYIKQMEHFRECFIELDEKLNFMSEDEMASSAANRCLALARTSLEQCSMYTNKALAIMGEE